MALKISRMILPAVLMVGLIGAAAHVASSNTGMEHGGHMHRHGGSSLGIPLPLLLRNANLTDAQKQQVHQIFESRHTSRKAEWEQLKAAKEQIKAKFASSGPVTAADLSGPMQQITQIQNQMAQEELQDALAVRNLLTPDQLKSLATTQSKLDQIRGEMKSLFAKSTSTGSPASSATATPTE
ncbi:MAG: hypothetical protein JWM69_1204 [Candidatus Binatus sp.]|nr:hypothetical protein [Candidatus Binatus sp.]